MMYGVYTGESGGGEGGGPQGGSLQEPKSRPDATPSGAAEALEPYGLLTPRGRSCNGRHERVSHRIGVIVDSNDMPVMRSHCVAKEI